PAPPGSIAALVRGASFSIVLSSTLPLMLPVLFAVARGRPHHLRAARRAARSHWSHRHHSAPAPRIGRRGGGRTATAMRGSRRWVRARKGRPRLGPPRRQFYVRPSGKSEPAAPSGTVAGAAGKLKAPTFAGAFRH